MITARDRRPGGWEGGVDAAIGAAGRTDAAGEGGRAAGGRAQV